MVDYERRLDKLEGSLMPPNHWNLARIIQRIDSDLRGDPLSPELQGEPYGRIVDCLANIGEKEWKK